MLTEMQEELKRQGGGTVARQGACKFCGQIATIEAGKSWTESDCDELATELCGCEDAYYYTMKKRRREKAIKAIEEQFGEKGEKCTGNILSMLVAMADMVEEEEIQSVTVDIGRGLKAKIGINAKGKIKVEKTKTEKETKEA